MVNLFVVVKIPLPFVTCSANVTNILSFVVVRTLVLPSQVLHQLSLDRKPVIAMVARIVAGWVVAFIGQPMLTVYVLFKICLLFIISLAMVASVVNLLF